MIMRISEIGNINDYLTIKKCYNNNYRCSCICQKYLNQWTYLQFNDYLVHILIKICYIFSFYER